MSVEFPEKDGIKHIKLDDEYWDGHTRQVGSEPAGNPKADNYAPGGFTGGTQPSSVGEPVSNYNPGRSTSPTKAAWRTVSGANINP